MLRVWLGVDEEMCVFVGRVGWRVWRGDFVNRMMFSCFVRLSNSSTETIML